MASTARVPSVSRKRVARSADLISLSQVTPSARKPPDWYSVRDLAKHALANGGIRRTAMRIAWNIAGDCQDGYTREIYARPPKTNKSWEVCTLDTRHSLLVELTTRCRRCDRCRKHRAALWRVRAKSETAQAYRTWMGTFTLRPEQQYRFRLVAIAACAKKNIIFEALPADDQFRCLHQAIGPELTKALKRLRKNTGVPFKFLLVAEAHKSGLPHYHALFHECKADRPLRYADLKREWPHGFTNFKLVDDPKDATYLCKYLAKSMLARVRASKGYGAQRLDDLPVIVQNYFARVSHDPTSKRKRARF